MTESGEDLERKDGQPQDPPAEKPEDKGGKEHPETVPWNQYVGLKEKFNKVETELKGKISGLEEKLTQGISAEEHERIKQELDTTKGQLQQVSDELKSIKEASIVEKRNALKSRGMPEEKVDAMSGDALNAALEALAFAKPAPDMGSGGGSGGLKGSPMELARIAYSTNK